MQLRNNFVLKIFSLLLLAVEFLAPAIVPDPGLFRTENGRAVEIHTQKHSGFLLSLFTEEASNNEEERSERGQEIGASFIPQNTFIHLYEVTSGILEDFDPSSSYSCYKAKFPLFKLNCSFVI